VPCLHFLSGQDNHENAKPVQLVAGPRKLYVLITVYKMQVHIPKHDMILIMEDFNAQVSREARFTQVARKHTLHERSNGNGELTEHFAIENDMIIASTMFQHKEKFMKVLGCFQVDKQ
jgi:hypothetical protein